MSLLLFQQDYTRRIYTGAEYPLDKAYHFDVVGIAAGNVGQSAWHSSNVRLK